MNYFLGDSSDVAGLFYVVFYLIALAASIIIPYWIIRLAVTHAIRATRIIEPAKPQEPPAPPPRRFAGPLEEANQFNPSRPPR